MSHLSPSFRDYIAKTAAYGGKRDESGRRLRALFSKRSQSAIGSEIGLSASVTLEDLMPGARVTGVLPDRAVTVVATEWHSRRHSR
jgi:hypothetical protein